MTDATYISVQRAAQLAGVHPETIRRRIADGTLMAARIGNSRTAYRIDVESFNWWLTPAASKSTNDASVG